MVSPPHRCKCTAGNRRLSKKSHSIPVTAQATKMIRTSMVFLVLIYGAVAFQKLKHPTILVQKEILKPLFSSLADRPLTSARKQFFDAQDLLQIIPLDKYAVPSVSAIQTRVARALKTSVNKEKSKLQGYPSNDVKESIYLHLWSQISGNKANFLQ